MKIAGGDCELNAMGATSPMAYIARHTSGDWGLVDDDDRRENERALCRWCPVDVGLSPAGRPDKDMGHN